jgi:hypothetical protein
MVAVDQEFEMYPKIKALQAPFYKFAILFKPSK